MGVYIEGMEIPRFGYREIRIHPDGKITERSHPEYPGYEECLGKAIPVPPHGRCIDESALLKGCGYIIADGMACIPVKYIANSPTIIEEEGE